ncbi:hypothetical protein HZS_3573 [Henneguya salminicola]|nr:hypothetical protein HZS_3573 [Henneguya salminicola]
MCCEVPDSLCQNPGECHSYIECDGHTPSIKYCQEKKIFDPYTKVCVESWKTPHVCSNYYNVPNDYTPRSEPLETSIKATSPLPLRNSISNSYHSYSPQQNHKHFVPRLNYNHSNHINGVLREAWFNLPNDDLSLNALIKDNRYPYFPDEYLILDTFEAPPNVGDYYGQRLSTYYLAPETGAFVFYLSCNEECELWMGKNVSEYSLEKVAYLTSNFSTEFREWNKFPELQATLFIQMIKDSFYLIEAFMRETRFQDHISVGVLKPSGKLELPVCHNLYLIPLHSIDLQNNGESDDII